MSAVALVRQARRLALELERTGSHPAKPLIVGELNPFGGRDYFALFPLPRTSSGGRLAGILGLSPESYLETFDRANLCRGAWSARVARDAAATLAEQDRPAFILLGKRVCEAFGEEYHPFTVGDAPGGSRFAVLPHPSGLNRAWNDPSATERARRTVETLGVDLQAARKPASVKCANCDEPTESGVAYDCQHCGRP